MDTLDYDYSLHTSDAGDKKLAVVFYRGFLKNDAKTESEGRAIFDDTDMIRIFTPGDRSNIIDRPVRKPDDLRRFPEQWSRYQNTQEQHASGTPIEQWPIVTRGQAEELKYLGFSTVEQIAEAKDGINYMGLAQLKAKAKAFLEIAKGNTAPIESLQKDLETEKANNRILAETVKKLNDQVGALLAAKAPKEK